MRGDLEWGTIPNLARSAAERFADDEALVDGDARLTFADLWTEARHAAKAYVAAGVEAGDRVAIWAPNIWEWPVALLGLQAAGAVAVPLNTRFKGGEAAYVLSRSRARLLVTVDGFLGNDYVAMLADQELPHLERIVVLRPVEGGAEDRPGVPPVVPWIDFLLEGAKVDDAVVDERLAALSPDDVSDIMFTSGTTGAPKGVMAAHGPTVRAYADWADLVGLRRGDRYLVLNPFFHSFGYRAGIVSSLAAGATMVPQAVFDVPEAMRNIADHRITMLPGAPAIYQTILNHPDLADFDLSSLRLAVTGAAAVPVSLVERMWSDLGFETVLTAYGLTEATGFVTSCRADDDARTVSETSGRAIPGVEVRIVSDDGVALPAGETGEIVVRGYQVMLGYFEDPEQTAEAVDVDGWLHTGDVGWMDEQGYVRITDRLKDMYIVGGFNAYPAEIENLLSRHPDIGQVAVIGVPDERLGEVGVAFVVPAVGHTPEPDAIVAWAREQMANYKVPRHVRIVDALPLNPSGKVLKYQLRDEVAR
ncbi:MAG TPA: FadD3 family acyl-CoA ligase [Acidimicrobiales bacterium]|nr:FadD3 family acyl-CoA ligase [Acidimicrobiales bacterium]